MLRSRKNDRPSQSSHTSYRRHKASGQAVVTLDEETCIAEIFGTDASKEFFRRVGSERLAGPFLLLQKSSELMTVNEFIAAHLRFASGCYKKNAEPTKEVAHLKCVLLWLHDASRYAGKTSIRKVRGRSRMNFRQNCAMSISISLLALCIDATSVLAESPLNIPGKARVGLREELVNASSLQSAEAFQSLFAFEMASDSLLVSTVRVNRSKLAEAFAKSESVLLEGLALEKGRFVSLAVKPMHVVGRETTIVIGRGGIADLKVPSRS
jgi:hypothetical protein